ncbi:MAG TPA: hypothetical protein VHI31_07105 [Actinomycetota bacterium]|nr:hypothetical protein [Actinomycetota bacterium]
MKLSRATHAVLAALMSMILLAACNNAEPEETEASPTTGDASAFDVEGTVQTVELENEGGSPEATATGSPTAGGPGTGSVTANIRARLVIEVESMKAETMELCDVEEGDQITLTLTNQTAFDQDQEPEDLTELEGDSIRAEGNAEELAAGDGTPGADEEASPAGSVSPEAGGGTMGANTTPEGASTQDPEAGCHFEVAKISVVQGNEGVGGIGDATSSPTPAPAGQGDVPGANATPGAAGTPTGQATPTATPGGTIIQGND